MTRRWMRALSGAAFLFAVIMGGVVSAAPYAAMVIDARTGKVLHSRNADTRLHPASLTKMMTLYVAFEAIRRGEITLDTRVRVSKNAASEPPSKLYLKAGQRIKLRDLIRASAVKSANDAATAIAEAISGSEAAFADRMNRTARALGMRKTTFKNANGLTQAGHLSTARDMTTLGRHLFYDYPQYYNLFSRRSTTAGGTTVANTNRRLLNAYKGADGIKTGYTRAAGFNLVASAERGNKRIIATMFGGSSGAARNARVAELLDMGFQRAPRHAAVIKPARPTYGTTTVRTASATNDPARLTTSLRPAARPARAGVRTDAAVVAALKAPDSGTTSQVTGNAATTVAAASTAAVSTAALRAPLVDATPRPRPVTRLASAAPSGARQLAATVSPLPKPRPAKIVFTSSTATPAAAATAETVVVPRVSTSDGEHWGIRVGTYASRYEAERVLLQTALVEIETLDSAMREVARSQTGFSANFVGLDERTASLACQRLSARAQTCETFGP